MFPEGSYESLSHNTSLLLYRHSRGSSLSPGRSFYVAGKEEETNKSARRQRDGWKFLIGEHLILCACTVNLTALSGCAFRSVVINLRRLRAGLWRDRSRFRAFDFSNFVLPPKNESAKSTPKVLWASERRNWISFEQSEMVNGKWYLCNVICA